jgi:hypothetical protein
MYVRDSQAMTAEQQVSSNVDLCQMYGCVEAKAKSSQRAKK